MIQVSRRNWDKAAQSSGRLLLLVAQKNLFFQNIRQEESLSFIKTDFGIIVAQLISPGFAFLMAGARKGRRRFTSSTTVPGNGAGHLNLGFRGSLIRIWLRSSQ